MPAITQKKIENQNIKGINGSIKLKKGTIYQLKKVKSRLRDLCPRKRVLIAQKRRATTFSPPGSIYAQRETTPNSIRKSPAGS